MPFATRRSPGDEGMNWDDLWSTIPQRLGRQRPRETGGVDLG